MTDNNYQQQAGDVVRQWSATLVFGHLPAGSMTSLTDAIAVALHAAHVAGLEAGAVAQCPACRVAVPLEHWAQQGVWVHRPEPGPWTVCHATAIRDVMSTSDPKSGAAPATTQTVPDNGQASE